MGSLYTCETRDVAAFAFFFAYAIEKYWLREPGIKMK